MSQAAVDWEAEYNNRARVPGYPEIMAGWERDAAAYRRERSAASQLGLSYGSHPRQAIDIFHPDQPDPARPLIVFIHGGYWRSLEPSLFSHLAAGANACGYTVAMPGYRLCPEVRVADTVDDARAACLFLQGRFGAPLVLCGWSAGGHLAAATAATDWSRHGASPAPVRHGMAISGLFDLAPLLHTSINETLRLDEAEARAASPIFRPPAADLRFETWVGELESAEFLRQSRDLAERWTVAGARTSFSIVPGANHFTAAAPLTEPGSALTQALVELCQACS